MKNNLTLVIIIASFLLISCGQTSTRKKELELKEREIALKEKELSLKEKGVLASDSIIPEKDKVQKSNQSNMEKENKNSAISEIETQCNILNIWLKDAIGYNTGININSFKKSNLNSAQNYKILISNSVKDKIAYRVTGLKPEIEISNKSIILRFENEEYSYEKFIILEDKFIYSYHAGAGDDRRCVLFDLLTNREKEYPFNIQSVQNDIAVISQDGYDNEGHFWQKGQLNLSTGSKNWGSKEH